MRRFLLSLVLGGSFFASAAGHAATVKVPTDGRDNPLIEMLQLDRDYGVEESVLFASSDFGPRFDRDDYIVLLYFYFLFTHGSRSHTAAGGDPLDELRSIVGSLRSSVPDGTLIKLAEQAQALATHGAGTGGSASTMIENPAFSGSSVFTLVGPPVVAVSAVPLPSSLPLFGAALLGLAAAGFGTRRARA